MSDITQILCRIESGDSAAGEELLPLVYDELRKLAAAKLANEKPGQTLQPTALVHETYLRLVGGDEPQRFRDHRHFFAVAAAAMRRVLIDNARRKQTAKRGARRQRVPLDDVILPLPNDELLALDEALEKLAEEHPDKAKLVELRYFAGLTADEAAAVLGISPSSVDRHWAYARAWLKAAVRGG